MYRQGKASKALLIGVVNSSILSMIVEEDQGGGRVESCPARRRIEYYFGFGRHNLSLLSSHFLNHVTEKSHSISRSPEKNK